MTGSNTVRTLLKRSLRGCTRLDLGTTKVCALLLCATLEGDGRELSAQILEPLHGHILGHQIDLVHHQHNTLVGVSTHDVVLDVGAATADRVTCIQHLQDHIACLHHLLELAEVGMSGGLLHQTRPVRCLHSARLHLLVLFPTLGGLARQLAHALLLLLLLLCVHIGIQRHLDVLLLVAQLAALALLLEQLLASPSHLGSMLLGAQLLLGELLQERLLEGMQVRDARILLQCGPLRVLACLSALLAIVLSNLALDLVLLMQRLAFALSLLVNHDCLPRSRERRTRRVWLTVLKWSRRA
mmetsp:Transcript_2356/g.7520  ORF Transcript_2356/g.7520 Transcript_2356/m.7520 type:complete len:298 (-) Transcript_2356:179-1072(-)